MYYGYSLKLWCVVRYGATLPCAEAHLLWIRVGSLPIAFDDCSTPGGTHSCYLWCQTLKICCFRRALRDLTRRLATEPFRC